MLAVSSHSFDEVKARGGLPAGVGFLGKPIERGALEQFLQGLSLRAVNPDLSP